MVEILNLVRQRKDGWLVLGVAVAAVVSTLAFWTLLPAELKENTSSDYVHFYEPVAEHVLQGRGLVTADGHVATRFPPGYPLLLAGVFQGARRIGLSQETALSFFILLCMGLATAIVYLLARSIWKPRTALIPPLVWMSYPLLLWLTKQPMSELPFIVFFYGAFFLFWRAVQRRSKTWYVYLFTGLLLGVSMLIRPIAIGLGVVLAGILWIAWRDVPRRVRVRVVGFLLLGNLLMVLPWEVYVHTKTDRIIPLSSAGVHALRDGLTFAINPRKTYRQGVTVPRDVAELMCEVYGRYDELDSATDVLSVMVGELKKRPGAVIKLYLLKAARSWYGTDSQRYERYLLLIQFPYLLLLLLAAVRALRRRGLAREFATAVGLVVLYFWTMNILSTTLVRYMVPVMGLLFVLLPALGPVQAKATPEHIGTPDEVDGIRLSPVSR